mmetsp:Transcript_2865/g.6540  ORF Transcript_2865/g.6540 Transcript_2865/m.6540 type:complete len:194 (-) Transcript_2865:81-662(-)
MLQLRLVEVAGDSILAHTDQVEIVPVSCCPHNKGMHPHQPSEIVKNETEEDEQEQNGAEEADDHITIPVPYDVLSPPRPTAQLQMDQPAIEKLEKPTDVLPPVAIGSPMAPLDHQEAMVMSTSGSLSTDPVLHELNLASARLTMLANQITLDRDQNPISIMGFYAGMELLRAVSVIPIATLTAVGQYFSQNGV